MHEDVNYDELVDIKEIIINQNDSKENKVLSYLKQIKNPNVYKNGEYTIIKQHNPDGLSLKECIIKLIRDEKRKIGQE